MGDAGGQLADGRHAVLETHLRLQLLHLGQVLKDERIAGRPAVDGIEGSDGETEASGIAADVKMVLLRSDYRFHRERRERHLPLLLIEEAEVAHVLAED